MFHSLSNIFLLCGDVGDGRIQQPWLTSVRKVEEWVRNKGKFDLANTILDQGMLNDVVPDPNRHGGLIGHATGTQLPRACLIRPAFA